METRKGINVISHEWLEGSNGGILNSVKDKKNKTLSISRKTLLDSCRPYSWNEINMISRSNNKCLKWYRRGILSSVKEKKTLSISRKMLLERCRPYSCNQINMISRSHNKCLKWYPSSNWMDYVNAKP